MNRAEWKRSVATGAIKDPEKAFQLIEAAAIAGARCPTNRSSENPNGELASGATKELARQGRIRIEVYAHNWRVAQILKGPHAGKRTAPPPNPDWRPYLIIDSSVTKGEVPK